MPSLTPVALILLALASGCAARSANHAALPPTASTVPPPARVAEPPSQADVERWKPDESGSIPVLMYHAVGGPHARSMANRYDRMGLNVSPDTFRRQLDLMYRAGWRPVNMRDLATPRIGVPMGAIPVVITFDDGRVSQFRYLPDGSIDPNCAIGILEAFASTHPDWPRRAVFYLNRGGFGQGRQEAQKLRFLVDRGYEIGNHTATHPFLSRLTTTGIVREVAGMVSWVNKQLPGVPIDTFALPFGSMPRSREGWAALRRGSVGATAYANDLVLRAWGGPTLPPAHRRFNPEKITRDGAAPGHIEGLIRALRPGGDNPAFVSDGIPDIVTVPRRRASLVSPQRLAGTRLFTYGAVQSDRARHRRAPGAHQP